MIFGIDFGTSNSCISYYDNIQKEIIVLENNEGKRIYASMIYIGKEEILYGDIVKRINNKENVFSNLKRLIGLKYSSLTEEIKEFFRYNKMINDNNEIKFKVNEKVYLVEELISLYLNYLKSIIIEKYLHKEIEVIITVPAYFNDNQREILKKCFNKIGLNVIRIINEPTAAGLAYKEIASATNGEEERILVFDCGGGTTDISIIDMDYKEQFYEVKSVIGDNFLGGEDITELISKFLKEKIEEKGINISKIKIKKESENIKKILSYKENISEIIIDDIIYKINISRNKLIEIIEPFMNKIDNLIKFIIKECNENCNGSVRLPEKVIFVGGSSRIPYFKELFYKYLGNVKINDDINPDEIVSIGASIQGANIKNMDKYKEMIVIDVIPLTLGIETLGGIMSPIVSRNTIIPVSRKKQFLNSSKYEDSIIVNIYQGERKFVKDNFFLTSFEIKDEKLEIYNKGELLIEIIFEIDESGIITAISKVKIDNKEEILNIIKTESKVDDNINLDKVLLESELSKLNDSILANKTLAKIDLYDSFKNLLKIFHEKRENILEGLNESSNFTCIKLNKLFDETFKVIKDYEKYDVKMLNKIKVEFEEKWHELLFTIDPIFKNELGEIIEIGGTEIE